MTFSNYRSLFSYLIKRNLGPNEVNEKINSKLEEATHCLSKPIEKYNKEQEKKKKPKLSEQQEQRYKQIIAFLLSKDFLTFPVKHIVTSTREKGLLLYDLVNFVNIIVINDRCLRIDISFFSNIAKEVKNVTNLLYSEDNPNLNGEVSFKIEKSDLKHQKVTNLIYSSNPSLNGTVSFTIAVQNEQECKANVCLTESSLDVEDKYKNVLDVRNLLEKIIDYFTSIIKKLTNDVNSEFTIKSKPIFFIGVPNNDKSALKVPSGPKNSEVTPQISNLPSSYSMYR